MDYLENINQLDWSIQTTRSQLDTVSRRIQELQERKGSLELRITNLTAERRLPGLEQYKDITLREGLLRKGKENPDRALSVIAIRLEQSGEWKKDDIDDEIINFFVVMENKNRPHSNRNPIGNFFDFLGKIGIGGESEVWSNDN